MKQYLKTLHLPAYNKVHWYCVPTNVKTFADHLQIFYYVYPTEIILISLKLFSLDAVTILLTNSSKESISSKILEQLL